MKSRLTIVGDRNSHADIYANLMSYEDYLVCTGYLDISDNMQKGIDRSKPDIVVVIVSSESGVEVLRWIKKKYSYMKLVVLFDSGEEELVINAMRIGIEGAVHSSSGIVEFGKCVQQVVLGDYYLGKRVLSTLFHSLRIAQSGPLTKREKEVLNLLSQGKSYTDVADELFIGKETVRSHIKNIYVKLGVSKKSHAIQIGREQKYI